MERRGRIGRSHGGVGGATSAPGLDGGGAHHRRHRVLASRARMISIVIPTYNEKESLTLLLAEIAETARQAPLDLEIVLVDDGSTDGSWPVIVELAKKDGRVRGLRFRRNFGKAAALSAGFRAAR